MNERDLLDEILKPIEKELLSLEIIMNESLKTEKDIFEKMNSYIMKTNQSHLHGALCIFFSKLINPIIDKGKDLINLATSLELINSAFKIHQELIDNEEIEKITKWDRKSLILYGDFLFSKGISLLNKFNSQEIITKVLEIIVEKCELKAEKIQNKDFKIITQNEYLDETKKQKANLIAESCWCGASFSNANENQLKLIFKYGLNFGMALGLVDDCISIMNKEEFEEGFFLNQNVMKILSFLSNEEKKRISNSLKKREKITRNKILILKGTEISLKKAKQYVDNAKETIAKFSPNQYNQYKESLIALADYILENI
jgi:geranylgeranyl pyrophosphate synthase